MSEVQTGVPGLTLRCWRDGDQADLLAHANDRSVWRNLADIFPHPYRRTDADNWVAYAGSADHPHLLYAIALDDRVIGGAGVMAGEGNFRFTGQFGYWLGRAHWGKGFATTCAMALKSAAFLRTPFVRLEAPVFEWNPASMRVLEKAGFAAESVRPKSMFKDGEIIDTHLYVALRP
ncbi:GNAT family N-acetyltransferase [Hydrogenophaga sp. 5NK40-0174]